MAVQKNNLRRLLRTVEALSDLGPEMTAEREFPQRAATMIGALLQAAGAREGVLFNFSDKPALLSSIAADGFALMPDPAVIPLLPKHVHALATARHPIILDATLYPQYLSANGNVAPELFKCIAPLTVGGKLVGLVALGHREGNALYDAEELDALELLCTIAGIKQRVAAVVIAEIGTDMSRFPSARHLCYWAALCPGDDESAGKRRSGHTRHGNGWLRTALVQAAWAAIRARRSCASCREESPARAPRRCRGTGRPRRRSHAAGR